VRAFFVVALDLPSPGLDALHTALSIDLPGGGALTLRKAQPSI
jgi:hypothetical protein